MAETVNNPPEPARCADCRDNAKRGLRYMHHWTVLRFHAVAGLAEHLAAVYPEHEASGRNERRVALIVEMDKIWHHEFKDDKATYSFIEAFELALTRVGVGPAPAPRPPVGIERGLPRDEEAPF